jgi:hypothetical protein
MTPAAGLAQRIGDSTSLSRLYLSTFPVSIGAGKADLDRLFFTDSLSERSRWIENPNFASSGRVIAYPQNAGLNRHVVGAQVPTGKEVANPS